MKLNDGKSSVQRTPLRIIKVSTVFDVVTCPQCGYKQADYKYDCCTNEETTACLRCGYYELREPKQGEGDGMTTLSTVPDAKSDVGNSLLMERA